MLGFSVMMLGELPLPLFVTRGTILTTVPFGISPAAFGVTIIFGVDLVPLAESSDFKIGSDLVTVMIRGLLVASLLRSFSFSPSFPVNGIKMDIRYKTL